MNKRPLRAVNVIVRLAAAGSLFLAASCSTPKENDTTAAPATPVKIVHPSTSSLVENYECNANTVFLKKEIVRSTFQGFIHTTNKSIGDKIVEGEILLSLRTKEALAADGASIRVNGKPLQGPIPVTAASSGVLTEMNYHTGDYVGEGEQLAVISNPSSLAVLLNVPYQDAPRIRTNGPCTLVLPNGREMEGIIGNSLPSVDPVSQTQTFIIRCSGLAHLPANLNIVVTIPVHQVRNATVLPKRSVQSNETLDSFWIMMLADDSTAVKIPIVKGAENDSLIQIISPALNARDRILAEGGYGLPDTARVSVQQ